LVSASSLRSLRAVDFGGFDTDSVFFTAITLTPVPLHALRPCVRPPTGSQFPGQQGVVSSISSLSLLHVTWFNQRRTFLTTVPNTIPFPHSSHATPRAVIHTHHTLGSALSMFLLRFVRSTSSLPFRPSYAHLFGLTVRCIHSASLASLAISSSFTCIILLRTLLLLWAD